MWFPPTHAGRPVSIRRARQRGSTVSHESETMKTSQPQPRGKRQRGGFCAGVLGVLMVCACHASLQADANVNTGGDGKEQVRDFDRPLEPAAVAKAAAEPEKADASETALL